MSRTDRPAPSVLAMAGPLVISFVMRSAFTMVDTAYAATLGDAAVAAVGFTVPFEFVLIAVWVGISTGLTACMSRALGAHEDDKLAQFQRVSFRIIACMIPLFLLLGLAIWFFAKKIGLDPRVAESFQIYGTVLLGGSALTAFWSLIPDSMIKAYQDTSGLMWAGICSNLANIIMNTIFVFVFHWGIFGIALSTVLGRIAGLIFSLRRVRAHEARRRSESATNGYVAGLDPTPLKSILRLALPSSANFVLIAVETGLVNWLLSGLDDSTPALAAYSINYRASMFCLNPVMALGVALLPYCASRFGARDVIGFKRGVREAWMAAVIYAVLATPLLYALAPWLARVLSETAQTRDFATALLRMVPAALFANMGLLLCRPAFEGLNQGRPGLLMALTRYVVLAFPSVLAGMSLAEMLGHPRIYGAVGGLIAASAVSSLIFMTWLGLTLRRHPELNSFSSTPDAKSAKSDNDSPRTS